MSRCWRVNCIIRPISNVIPGVCCKHLFLQCLLKGKLHSIGLCHRYHKIFTSAHSVPTLVLPMVSHFK